MATARDKYPGQSSRISEDSSPPSRNDPTTYLVIGAAQKVHRSLGPGFTEATYQKAMQKELMPRKIPFETQRVFEVWYEGNLCGTYRSDLLVANEVIVELKAIAALAPEHGAQTISYLKASGMPTGLLINFGAASLQVKRFRD
jgi:GxxExxY protein